MEKEEIVSAVNGLLIQEFEINEKEIHPGARLKDDLGLESLDFVDIAVMVKKRFGINVKGKDMLSVKTLGDVYDFIYSRAKNQ
jgi:acyl carrier protein